MLASLNEARTLCFTENSGWIFFHFLNIKFISEKGHSPVLLVIYIFYVFYSVFFTQFSSHIYIE